MSNVSIVSLFENYNIEIRSSLFVDEINFPDATEIHLFKNAKIEVDSYICIGKVNVSDDCLRRYLRGAEVHSWATVKIEGCFFSGNHETETLFFYNNSAIRSKSDITKEQLLQGQATIKPGTELIIDEIII